MSVKTGQGDIFSSNNNYIASLEQQSHLQLVAEINERIFSTNSTIWIQLFLTLEFRDTTTFTALADRSGEELLRNVLEANQCSEFNEASEKCASKWKLFSTEGIMCQYYGCLKYRSVLPRKVYIASLM